MFMKKNLYQQNNKLRFLPNTLLLPHIGYVTAENYSIFLYTNVRKFRSLREMENLLELLAMNKKNDLTEEQNFILKEEGTEVPGSSDA